MKLCRIIVSILMLLGLNWLAVPAAAQAAAQTETCEAVVQSALDTVGESCAVTGRNQACYGYVSLQATARQGTTDFSFTQQGDLVNVADIDRLHLSRLDVEQNVWGIALMKLQANLPDSLPGQNVTFLVFGDVQVENASTRDVTVSVTATNNLNIRSAPSTHGAVIGSFASGTTATADGRNADGSWLHIQLTDDDARGWVFANLVTASGDASSLAVIDSTEAEPSYTPMQAFYFQSGITQTDCAQAPQDGILIQTPKGVGKISLRANDVDIRLGSTAYLQAQPNGSMSVSVVEGEGQVTAMGKTVDVPAGTQTTVPMDADLKPAGVPSDAQPYDATLVAPLPVGLLPDAITIAPPATPAAPAPDASSEATPEATEPPSSGSVSYEVQTIMDVDGAVVSGTICALDQPFVMRMVSALFPAGFDVSFTPTDATHGSWGYVLPEGSYGGTYTISEPAADGSRRMTFTGEGYEAGLMPITPCGG